MIIDALPLPLACLIVPVASPTTSPLIDKLLLAMLWEATVSATINPKGKTRIGGKSCRKKSRFHVLLEELQ